MISGYDEYHSFIHGHLPYENVKPDPVLRSLLLSLPLLKVIFTNGYRVHAAKALKKLGVEDCLEGIICFETLNPTMNKNATFKESKIFDIVGHFNRSELVGLLPKTSVVCKPSESAIEKALEIASIYPNRTLFFEDSVRKVQAGKRVGLDIVLVGKSNKFKGADYALENIHNLKEALPELWESDRKSLEAGYSGKIAVETSVTA